MHKSRKSCRIFALGLVLLPGAPLGSATPVGPSGLPAGPPQVKRLRKISPAGVRPFQSFACVTLGIGCNTTVNGALTSDDCRLPLDQSLYDAWTFEGTVGQSVQITMQSTAFDTFLFLLDPGSSQVDQNDDYPGGGTNSRISYTVPASGTYTIIANSFSPGVTGTYTLILTCAGGPTPTPTVLPTSTPTLVAPSEIPTLSFPMLTLLALVLAALAIGMLRQS